MSLSVTCFICSFIGYIQYKDSNTVICSLHDYVHKVPEITNNGCSMRPWISIR